MIISEVIKELEELKKEHGDIPVVTNINVGYESDIYTRMEIQKKYFNPMGAIKFACCADRPDYELLGGYTKEACILIDSIGRKLKCHYLYK